MLGDRATRGTKLRRHEQTALNAFIAVDKHPKPPPVSRLGSDPFRTRKGSDLYLQRQCEVEPRAVDQRSMLTAVQRLPLRGSDVKDPRVDQLPVVVSVAWTRRVATKQIVEGTIGRIRRTSVT